MGTVTEVKNGAKAVTAIQTEISEEIPRYREMAETITTVVVFTAAIIACTCLVVIARNMLDIYRAP